MPLILGTNSIKDTGYDVANSLRFNTASSDFLNRTHGTNSSAVGKFTFSFWFKRGIIETEQVLTTAFVDGNNVALIRINANNTLEVYDYQSSYKLRKITNRVFRDVSAWYHIVVEVDTTQGTASNRFKLYVNGVQETSFSTDTNYSQNDATFFNKNVPNFIGKINTGSPAYFNGYMAEFCFIDGTAYDEENFGEFDSDSPTIWKPIDVSGLTFGNNGFYLDFEDSSALGNDANGSNNFTVNNLTAIDQSTDTCTNNFCTWNSIADNLDVTLSEGNLKVVHGTNMARRPVISTFGVSKGKWFWEWKNTTSSTPANIEVGIVNYASPSSQGNYLGQSLQGDADFTTYVGDGNINMSGSTSASGTTYTTETISVAVDMDNTLIYFYKNGSLVNSGGTNFSGMEDGSGFIFMANADRSGGSSYTASVNFGNPPYSESGGNSDGNGYGNFSMAVPSGFYSLCTKNLAEYG